MILAAASASFTPGSSMTIWSEPCFVMFGSLTPSLSTRFRMVDDFDSGEPREHAAAA